LNASLTFNKHSPSEKKGGNCHILADSHWEILFKDVGQPMGTAKGCTKAAGKWPKAIGKSLGNS
jgi:hypothetical protein